MQELTALYLKQCEELALTLQDDNEKLEAKVQKYYRIAITLQDDNGKLEAKVQKLQAEVLEDRKLVADHDKEIEIERKQIKEDRDNIRRESNALKAEREVMFRVMLRQSDEQAPV